MVLPWRKLPGCDEVFLRYFDPWYDDRQRAAKGFSATRPDMVVDESLRGATEVDASPLVPDIQERTIEQVLQMTDAARSDWKSDHGFRGNDLRELIAEADAKFDRKYVKALLKNADPSDSSNDVVIHCCELGAVLGELLRQRRPALRWVAGSPYWESLLLDSDTGTLVAPFHWAIKRFSEYAVEDGLLGKVEACVAALEKERRST